MSAQNTGIIDNTPRPLLSQKCENNFSKTANFSPTKDQIEKMDLLKMELDLLLTDEDRIKFESVQNSRFMTRIIKLKSLMNYLKKYGLWEIVEQEQARHQEQETSEKPKPKRKRSTGLKYDCQKRISLLNTVYELEKANVEEIALTASYDRSRCNGALKDLLNKGHVSREKVSRTYFYSITKEGRIFLQKFCCAFYQCDFLDTSRKTHCQNAQQREISVVLETYQALTKKLLGWGIYHRWIKKIFKGVELSEILSQIKYVENRKDIKNKGAYLFTALVKKKNSLSRRVVGMAKRVLGKFSIDVQEKFIEEARKTDCAKTALHLASAVRKRGEKMLKRFGFTLQIWDVETTMNYLRKTKQGARLCL